MNNTINSLNLRLEIAILQEDIESKSPKKSKFKIPVLNSSQSQTNISLLKSSTNKYSSINLSDYIELDIPLEYTYFYPEDIIPKGTKFIVGFIGGNINDPHIVGRY